MAVTSVHEINDGRQGDGSVTREKSTRSYTRVFRVITSDPDDETVIVSAGVASAYGIYPGAPYPDDFTAYCSKLSCRPEGKSKMIWTATATYSSEFQFEQNPLDDPAIIEWGSSPYQRAFTQDNAGHAILNSAGEYYYQPVMGDDSRWEVTIQKNLAAVPSWILTYKDAINSDTFTLDGITIAQYVAKLSAIRIGKWQTRNAIAFRVVSLTMHLDAVNTWVKSILDEGLNQVLGGVLWPCTDNQGVPVKVAVPLNGSGVQLAGPSPTTVVYNSSHIYPELAFSSLPLT